MIQIGYWVLRVGFAIMWAIAALRSKLGTRRVASLKSQIAATGGAGLIGDGKSVLLDASDPGKLGDFFQFAALTRDMTKAQVRLERRKSSTTAWVDRIGWLTTLRGRKCPYLAGVIDVAFIGWWVGAVNTDRVRELAYEARHLDWATIASWAGRILHLTQG